MGQHISFHDLSGAISSRSRCPSSSFVVPGCLQNLFTRLSFDEQQRQSNHEHVVLLIRNLSVGELRFSILKIHSIRSIRAIRSCSRTSPIFITN